MTYSVSKFPVDGGGCGWYEILPKPPPPRILDQDIETDWLVIGAGFTGLAAAHRLRKNLPGDQIKIIDAQRIAWGASGRNSGFMIDLPHNLQSHDYRGDNQSDLDQIKRNRFAIDYARSIIKEYDLIDVGSDIGRINAATDTAGLAALDRYAVHLENLGEPFVKLDQADLERITGTHYYRGGIHMPGCFLIQPAAYIRGLSDSLTKSKVSIFENSPVLNIDSPKTNNGNLNSGVFRVRTANGTVRARHVILTVNGQLESFGLSRNRLMHITLYGSMTAELTAGQQQALGGESDWGITPAHPMGSTIRKFGGNRIVVRNHITYSAKGEPSQRQMESSIWRHEQSFRNRFPMLADVELEHSWSGQLCLSRNSVSVFGEIENNLFVACCHNGLGATNGTLNGVLIADQASQSETAETKAMIKMNQDADQPSKLFPEPFMSLGAKSHLWWGQRMAGLEI